VLNLELVGLGCSELQPPHPLGDVSNCNGHFVVLVGLDVLEEDLRWEDFDRVSRVAKVVDSRIVQHRLGIPL
jgi:hypothetical protein